MTSPLELRSERLRQLQRLCPPGARIADVGCDHALLPIALISSDHASFAVAADLRPGPLAFARENIAQANLEQRIDVRLGDGLEPISSEDRLDLVYIAGMGTRSIIDILAQADLDALGRPRLVAQSPQDLTPLRRHIWEERGACVLDEILLWEDEQLYHTLHIDLTAAPTTPWRELSPEARLLGAPLLENRQNTLALRRYLERKIERVQIRYDGMCQARALQEGALQAVRDELEMLKEICAPYLH